MGIGGSLGKNYSWRSLETSRPRTWPRHVNNGSPEGHTVLVRSNLNLTFILFKHAQTITSNVRQTALNVRPNHIQETAIGQNSVIDHLRTTNVLLLHFRLKRLLESITFKSSTLMRIMKR